MVDDAYLLSLAEKASGDLSSVAESVASISDVILPRDPEFSLLSLDDGETSGVQAVAVPDSFFDDLMSFQYMQTVTGFFVLAALLLNFGALLFLSFSDKWRC